MNLKFYPPPYLESPFRFGDYELLSLLGSGGMGQVFEARRVKVIGDEEVRLQAAYALKIPSVQLLRSDPTIAKQMLAEARAAAKISHPNVVGMLDVGDVGGIPFLVMDYLDGHGLEVELQNGPIPLEQAIHIGIEVATALDEIHRAGLVHRDLKPSNIFLTTSGDVKLLDLGIAKNVDAKTRLTGTGLSKGTPGYMAPEQLVRGARLDGQVDVFALGAVLAEMILGGPVFYGSTLVELLMLMPAAEEHVAADSISTRVDAIAPGLGPLVVQCMRQEPHNRPSGAAVVRDQLIDLSTGVATDDVPAESPESPPSPTETPGATRSVPIPGPEESPEEELPAASKAVADVPERQNEKTAPVATRRVRIASAEIQEEPPRPLELDPPSSARRSRLPLFVALVMGVAALGLALVGGSSGIAALMGAAYWNTAPQQVRALVWREPAYNWRFPPPPPESTNRIVALEAANLALDGKHEEGIRRLYNVKGTGMLERRAMLAVDAGDSELAKRLSDGSESAIVNLISAEAFIAEGAYSRAKEPLANATQSSNDTIQDLAGFYVAHLYGPDPRLVMIGRSLATWNANQRERACKFAKRIVLMDTETLGDVTRLAPDFANECGLAVKSPWHEPPYDWRFQPPAPDPENHGAVLTASGFAMKSDFEAAERELAGVDGVGILERRAMLAVAAGRFHLAKQLGRDSTRPIVCLIAAEAHLVHDEVDDARHRLSCAQQAEGADVGSLASYYLGALDARPTSRDSASRSTAGKALALWNTGLTDEACDALERYPERLGELQELAPEFECLEHDGDDWCCTYGDNDGIQYVLTDGPASCTATYGNRGGRWISSNQCIPCCCSVGSTVMTPKSCVSAKGECSRADDARCR